MVVFSVAAVAVYRAAFGQGTGPLFLYNVRCTGTESSLLNCSHELIDYYYNYHYYYQRYCSYYNDAGVVCPSRKLCVWHKYRDSHLICYYSWTGVSFCGHSDNAEVLAYCTIILTAELYILSCL